MPTTNGIFYENQSGGLCRMHSLNAFFGKSLIDSKQFQKYMDMFDNQMKTKYKEDISCKKFDLVNSDQNNIISFILKKKGYYARYIPLNGINRKALPLEDVEEDFIFMYNESHIWGMRKHNGAWYTVDSMRGVRKVNIHRITRTKNVGFMIPINMRKELFSHVGEIKSLLEREEIKSKAGVCKYLKKLNANKEILGDLEVHLGVAMDLIEAQANGTDQNKSYGTIYDLIEKYNLFLQEFIEKKYSLESIEKYVPDIIATLMKICFNVALA